MGTASGPQCRTGDGAKKKPPSKDEGFSLEAITACSGLVVVVADALVVATPPIWAASDGGLTAQPIAVVTIGGVTGTIGPDPCAIPEDPLTIVELAMIVVITILRGIVFFAAALEGIA